MTKREFVEQAAMRMRAAIAAGDQAVSVPRSEHAVTEALKLWDEIEKRVPPPSRSNLGEV